MGLRAIGGDSEWAGRARECLSAQSTLFVTFLIPLANKLSKAALRFLRDRARRHLCARDTRSDSLGKRHNLFLRHQVFPYRKITVRSYFTTRMVNNQ